MKDLILSKNNSLNQNILAIIDFIKQVEYAHGYNDEQIIHKYTCGECEFLAQTIVDTIKALYGNIKIKVVWKCAGWPILFEDSHCYAQIVIFGKRYFYDIFGRKTEEELWQFNKSDYWEKACKRMCSKDPEFGRADEDNYKTFYNTAYVKRALKKHIQMEGGITV